MTKNKFEFLFAKDIEQDFGFKTEIWFSRILFNIPGANEHWYVCVVEMKLVWE